MSFCDRGEIEWTRGACIHSKFISSFEKTPVPCSKQILCFVAERCLKFKLPTDFHDEAVLHVMSLTSCLSSLVNQNQYHWRYMVRRYQRRIFLLKSQPSLPWGMERASDDRHVFCNCTNKNDGGDLIYINRFTMLWSIVYVSGEDNSCFPPINSPLHDFKLISKKARGSIKINIPQ